MGMKLLAKRVSFDRINLDEKGVLIIFFLAKPYREFETLAFRDEPPPDPVCQLELGQFVSSGKKSRSKAFQQLNTSRDTALKASSAQSFLTINYASPRVMHFSKVNITSGIALVVLSASTEAGIAEFRQQVQCRPSRSSGVLHKFRPNTYLAKFF